MQLALDVPEAYRTVWTQELTDGTGEYEMPANFEFDKKVEYRADTDDIRKLDYVTFEEWNNVVGKDETNSWTPLRYTFWRKLGGDQSASPAYVNDYIRLNPVPGSDEDGNFIGVYGFKRPDIINVATEGDHVIETPASYVEAQIMWAAYLVMSDDGDFAASDRKKTEYEHQVVKIKNHIAITSRSERPRIRPRNSALNPWNKDLVPWPSAFGRSWP
jgi:hypothetical protein